MTSGPDIPTNGQTRHGPRRALAAGGVMAIALVFAAGYALTASRGADTVTARQAEVKSRGASVMPFDLDRTTHVFTDRADGGVQIVTADDPADSTQVGLIQQHLREEADKPPRGDFADPSAIHGQTMPGLAELKAGASRITVRYEAVSSGGQLRYTTSDPTLVAAIHSWFKAQSMDHGSPHSSHQR